MTVGFQRPAPARRFSAGNPRLGVAIAALKVENKRLREQITAKAKPMTKQEALRQYHDLTDPKARERFRVLHAGILGLNKK